MLSEGILEPREYTPKRLTPPGIAGLFTAVEIQNFVYFVTQTAHGHATQIDRARTKSSGSPDAIDVLRTFGQMLFEMVLQRAADNFLTYVADLLALVFTKNPHVLKSQEKVSYEEVLECTTMDEVVSRLAERRIHELSYKGMRELQNDLSKRMNFWLFESDEDLDRAIFLIEARNLIAHNQGRVNRIFLARVKGIDTYLEGQRLQLNFDDVESNQRFLLEAVLDIDRRASEKFVLPTQMLGVKLSTREPWRIEKSYHRASE